MDTAKRQKRILNLFHKAGKAYVDHNGQSKLTIAVEKIIRKTKLAMNDLVEDEADIQKRNAMTEKGTGKLFKDANGNLEYTVSGEKKMREELRALFDEEIDIPVHIVTEFDSKTLTTDLRYIFEGIVIPERNLDDEIENFNPKEPNKKGETPAEEIAKTETEQQAG